MVSGSHTIPISLGILMGIVWVPLTIFGGPMSLGVPENPIDPNVDLYKKPYMASVFFHPVAAIKSKISPKITLNITNYVPSKWRVHPHRFLLKLYGYGCRVFMGVFS